MHNKKREEQQNAEPAQHNSAEEKLFHSSEKENGASVAESLAKDQQFRKFFTTSVIEVPEEMRKIDRSLADAEEPEEKPRRGKGGWLKNIFSVSDDEDLDEVDVRIPAEAQGQAQETEDGFAGRLEPIEEDQPEPQPARAQTPAKQKKKRAPAHAKRISGETQLYPEHEPLPLERAEKQPAAEQERERAAAGMPTAEHAASETAERQTPAATAAPQPTAGKPTEKPLASAPAPQGKRTGKKARSVDVGSLLEQIDEVQANVAGTGHEAVQKAPAAQNAKQAAKASEPIMMLEPSTAELADRAPQQAGKADAPAQMPADDEKALRPAQAADDTAQAPQQLTQAADPLAQTADSAEPQQPAMVPAGAKKAPTGRIVFADEVAQGTAAAAAQPTGRADAAQTTAAEKLDGKNRSAHENGAEAQQAATDDTRVYAPEGAAPAGQPAAPNASGMAQRQEKPAISAPVSPAQGEQTQPESPQAGQAAEENELDNGPTKELPLDAESTGEIALSAASEDEDDLRCDEPTGEVPLMGQEPGEQEQADEPELEARPHGWKRLTRLFAGEEEPEEPETENEPTGENAALASDDTGELEYRSTEDADAIRNELEARAAALTLRCTLSAILAVALIVLDLMGQGVVPSPAILDPVAAPAAWLGVHLILLGICIVLALPVLRNGVVSLLPHHTASADALAALAAVAAVLQTASGLLFSGTFDSAQITMFSGAAALLLFANLLGQRLALDAVRDGFAVMTSGVDNATGYCLADKRLLQTLCAGMDEKDPVLLLSRPGSLLKNFMAQSFAPHRSDRLAVEFARTLGVVALVGFGITLAKGRGLTAAFSVMAAILCMGAPLSAALIRAIPSRLMQRAAAQVGAVIPGWPAIEQLGEVDIVQADAAELFPPMCAHLYGIKTFQKERIDLAILYATSILIESCNTLSGLFRNMIENHTDMLYPVKDLEKRVGLGYLAWCDNCRVLLGTRELMSAEGIALPAMDYENRYTQNGDRHVLYLAVSGQLYAMFLYGYTGTKKVAHTLSILRRENIRLLVTADDPTLTETRIEEAYRLRPGFVKVLSGEEAAAMAPATAYLPATDGCLVHLGGFASLIGGLQAAAGADGAEHNACTIQTVSVVVSVLLGLLLSFAGGLAHISLAAVLLYQIAWSALSVAITLTKKY